MKCTNISLYKVYIKCPVATILGDSFLRTVKAMNQAAKGGHETLPKIKAKLPVNLSNDSVDSFKQSKIFG